MKKFSSIDLWAIIVWLLPLGYLVYSYPSIPSTMPSHYNIHGNVTSYGTRSGFLTVQLILLALPVIVYPLFRILTGNDPRIDAKYGAKTFQKAAFGFVIFMSAVVIIIIYLTAHRT